MPVGDRRRAASAPPTGTGAARRGRAARRRRRRGRSALRGSRGRGRAGDHESGQRPRDADVEEHLAVGERAADADEGAEGADEAQRHPRARADRRPGRGDEEGQARVDAVAAAGDVVAHLVGEHDADDRRPPGARRPTWPMSPAGPDEVDGGDGQDERDDVRQRAPPRRRQAGGAELGPVLRARVFRPRRRGVGGFGDPWRAPWADLAVVGRGTTG